MWYECVIIACINFSTIRIVMAYNKDYNIGDVFGGIGSIGSIFTGLPSIITNAVQGKKQREANMQATRETNAQNERLVDKQNAAAAAESEKQRAYESAPAQVSRLRSAGMSKAGALGAINGAGGYTPAPVNAAQAQAPTAEYQPVDFSGLANAMQGMAQLSMQKEQLKQQKYEYQRSQKLEEDKFFEEQKNNAKARELTDANIARLAKENEVSDAQIEQIVAGTSLTWQQVDNACADYNIKLAELAYVKEQTKLTTEQILQAKAATYKLTQETNLVKQQVLTEMHNTSLKEYEADIAFENSVKIAQEVSEFMRPDAQKSREDAIKLNGEILKFARDIKMSEADIKELEKMTAQETWTMDHTPASYPIRSWEYVVSRAVPLRGLVSITTK